MLLVSGFEKMLNKELNAICLSIDRDRHRETKAEKHVKTAQEHFRVVL